jgi:hypothetical protein
MAQWKAASTSSTVESALVITKQPEEEFYKDEGGKSNFMHVIVRLDNKSNISDKHQNQKKSKTKKKASKKHSDNKQLAAAEKNNRKRKRGNSEVSTNGSGGPSKLLPHKVPLKCSLYFESGNPIDTYDRDILRLEKNSLSEHHWIDPCTLSTTIGFRIEKVSRRKDGQKFKLRLEVDMDKASEIEELAPVLKDLRKVEGVFTSPIFVLSKRKKIHRTKAKAHTKGIKAQQRYGQQQYNENAGSGHGGPSRSDCVKLFNHMLMIERRLNTKLEMINRLQQRCYDAIQNQSEQVREIENVVNTLCDPQLFSTAAAVHSASAVGGYFDKHLPRLSPPPRTFNTDSSNMASSPSHSPVKRLRMATHSMPRQGSPFLFSQRSKNQLLSGDNGNGGGSSSISVELRPFSEGFDVMNGKGTATLHMKTEESLEITLPHVKSWDQLMLPGSPQNDH